MKQLIIILFIKLLCHQLLYNWILSRGIKFYIELKVIPFAIIIISTLSDLMLTLPNCWAHVCVLGGCREGHKIHFGFQFSHAPFPVSPPRIPGVLPVWFARCQVEVPLSLSCWTWVGSSATYWVRPRQQTMGESPLTWPSLRLLWLSPYLRAEAQAEHYAMILFIRTKRAQPTKGGRGSPLPFYLICSKSGL